MFTRIFLFLLTNILVIALLSFIMSVFNIAPYINQYGLNYTSLLIFAAIFGFGGALISLFLSKFMAKMAYRIQIIKDPKDQNEAYLFQTVKALSDQMHIGMPDVWIYQSPELNAFATGWNRNKALVSVSSGMLEQMSKDEIEGVLGHEMSHVRNGDMVTMTLLQGIINTFVIFGARVAAFFVSKALARGEDSQGLSYFTYFLVSIVFEIIFGILASTIVMWYSRKREFRADAGSAQMLGKSKMITSLKKLQSMYDVPEDPRGEALQNFKINHKPKSIGKLGRLFRSHPPLSERIAALEK